MPTQLFPPYMLGRFVGSVAVAGVTFGLDGTITVSSTVAGDLHTSKTLAAFQPRSGNVLEDITPPDQRQANNVPTQSDIDLTIAEIRVVATAPILEQIAAGFDYIRVQRNFAPPGATSATTQVWAAILAIGDYDPGDVERGENRVTLTAKSAGIQPYIGYANGTIPF